MNTYCSSCGQPLASFILDDETKGDELCLQCELRRRVSDERPSQSPPREPLSQEDQLPSQKTMETDAPGNRARKGQGDDDQNPASSSSNSESFSDMDREEAHRRLLRARGFDLEYDPHGFRLKSAGGTRNSSISELSPYEIVRLAAEINGETVPLEERIRCPNCEAVVSPSDRKCQWCSQRFQE
jgi:hypothetical protein